MARIGFAPHSERPKAVRIAKSVGTWLVEQGHQAFFLEPRVDQAKPEDLADLDLLVSLGGDGTMLRAVGLALGTGVPVLGANVGLVTLRRRSPMGCSRPFSASSTVITTWNGG
jgi:NAD+ kinase